MTPKVHTESSSVDRAQYVPADVVAVSVVEVGPGGMAFMGEWVLDRSSGRVGEDADALQLHYYRLIAPGDEKRGFFTAGDHHEASVHESDQTEAARERFLESSREILEQASRGGALLLPVGAGHAP